MLAMDEMGQSTQTLDQKGLTQDASVFWMLSVFRDDSEDQEYGVGV